MNMSVFNKNKNSHQAWQRGFNVFMILLGYMLSPLSFWNDVYFNIPVSYYLTIPISGFFGINKIFVFSVIYILTNIVGLAIFEYYSMKEFDIYKHIKKFRHVEIYLAIFSVFIILVLFVFGYIEVPSIDFS